jgi:glycosyltransferase involved in cell wall biosynthesis
MRVLMLTRRIDREDWLAGFAHGWVAALAAHPRIERVEVICLELGAYDLPGNVRVTSMGKERGAGRLRELLTAQRTIARAIRHVDVIFAHMIPRYALIAAPWAKLFGVPLVLWYTHLGASAELRLAYRLVDRLVTASPESFTLPGRKVTVIGHGIDLSRFFPADDAPAERLVLAVGRLSPIKHYEALIAAAARLAVRPGFEDVRVAIAGGVTPQHPDYAASLQALIADLRVGERIELLGPVPYEQMPALYRRAAVTANLCPTGGVDKVVLESMASGVPAVVHNETFLPLLGDDAGVLFCPDLDPDHVADRLAALLALPPQERAALGARLAARVRAGYGLDALIERLVAVFEELAP